MRRHVDRAGPSLRLNFKLCVEGTLSVFLIEDEHSISAIFSYGSFAVCGLTTETFNRHKHAAFHDKMWVM